MTDISTKRYNLDNFEASFREFLQNNNNMNVGTGRDLSLRSNSIKNYLSDLRHFWGWFTFYLHSNQAREGQAPPLQENPLSLASMIDFEAVSSYKVYLESNALPIKTINRRLSTLRKFCSFCINQNWMKENPAKRVGNVGGIHDGKNIHGGRDVINHVSTEKNELDINLNKHVILSEFKLYLLSGQADPNVETGHAPSLHKNSDTNLILDDVQEFLSICHPA